jgi:hypothetical protein
VIFQDFQQGLSVNFLYRDRDHIPNKREDVKDTYFWKILLIDGAAASLLKVIGPGHK